MAFVFLMMFYAVLEGGVYYTDNCMDKDATLCVGEGVADSVTSAWTGGSDWVKEQM